MSERTHLIQRKARSSSQMSLLQKHLVMQFIHCRARVKIQVAQFAGIRPNAWMDGSALWKTRAILVNPVIPPMVSEVDALCTETGRVNLYLLFPRRNVAVAAKFV